MAEPLTANPGRISDSHFMEADSSVSPLERSLKKGDCVWFSAKVGNCPRSHEPSRCGLEAPNAGMAKHRSNEGRTQRMAFALDENN
jgi:hypothetical protein